jgi:5-hydroxyisourate hydrolase-like protein (transthyretin family)
MKVALLAATLAFIAGAQTFPVSGVVINAQTGAPLKRARVVLTKQEGGENAWVTGEDGRFSFLVPKGKYGLTTEYRGGRQRYGQSAGMGFGVALYTGPDQATSDLVFRWFPPGAISGKILDDRSEPAQSMLVQLIRTSVISGLRRSTSAGWAYTNDLGEYRLGYLPAGTYYLAVTGQPWYAQPAIPSRSTRQQVNAGEGPPVVAYAPTYYPNALDADGASALVLAPGAEVTADFSLRTINGVNVQVHCPLPKGPSTGLNMVSGRRPELSLTTDGIDGVDGFQRQIYFVGEWQTIPAVPPGHYVLRAMTSGENPLLAQKTVDVRSTDVTVELNLQPPPSTSGKVAFKNQDSKPHGTLFLRLINERSGYIVGQTVDATGSFTLPIVPFGKWRPQLSGSDGFFISQLSVEGAPFQDGLIEIGEGATVRLSVVASHDVGRLKGFVKNDDRPVAGVLVILAQRDRAYPSAFRSFQTDSDGSFDFTNVPAGDYKLLATDRLDLEYTNADVLRPYLKSSKSAHIAPGSASSQDLGISTPQLQQ